VVQIIFAGNVEQGGHPFSRLFPFLLFADMMLVCNLPVVTLNIPAMHPSYHFFWNVNFLTDISDVDKSKIDPIVRIYLPPSHTISLDGALPSNIFLFQLCSDAFQGANDHMLRERTVH
jgi:hypothetical protein